MQDTRASTASPLYASTKRDEVDASPTIKYINSTDLYNVTSGRRDSKASTSSSTRNDYYYDKENELYSRKKDERDVKLISPREERAERIYEQKREHRSSTTYTSKLSPIASPTPNVIKNFLN